LILLLLGSFVLIALQSSQSYRITSLAGRVAWNGSASEFPLNVSSFAKGIYLVNILSVDGVKTEKVIIK
jgi:hypothetical protein